MKARLAITLGDINGIGPEILVKALAHPAVMQACEPLVVGDATVLDALRTSDGPNFRAVPDARAEVPWATVPVLDCGFAAPPRHPGEMDPAAGRCAVEWLKAAVRLAQEGLVQGIVTCPLNKECIHRAGYLYSGHTEILAELTASPEYRMCLFMERMRIVHNSAHCALSEAIALVTTERVAASIRIGHEALRRLALPRQRIAVAGLNPHAGEAGLFGREELDTIAPAVEICRAEGIDCSGPYPPDTVFRRAWQGEFDLVVAMYHDQGHIPLKLVAMDDGVNVTLGIPIVRTSVDHGTAYDLAGTNRAREHSLCAAIHLAVELARQKSR